MAQAAQKQILVVEDNPDISDLIAEVLTEAGYKVVCSRSALEGLVLLTQSPSSTFHLITLDLGLPGMSGNAFLRELAGHSEEAFKVPVVVVTANPYQLEAFPQVKGIVDKPFDLKHLLETINRAA